MSGSIWVSTLAHLTKSAQPALCIDDHEIREQQQLLVHNCGEVLGTNRAISGILDVPVLFTLSRHGARRRIAQPGFTSAQPSTELTIIKARVSISQRSLILWSNHLRRTTTTLHVLAFVHK